LTKKHSPDIIATDLKGTHLALSSSKTCKKPRKNEGFVGKVQSFTAFFAYYVRPRIYEIRT
jgi:hypothetical protein